MRESLEISAVIDGLAGIIRDTRPEAMHEYYRCIREMTPAERIRQGRRLTRRMQKIAATGIRDRHPEYTSEQVQRALNRLLWGETLWHAVYPDETD